ncbi:MAG: tRNA pseudouridine(13) synthase TruD [Fuerstiella sp.]
MNIEPVFESILNPPTGCDVQSSIAGTIRTVCDDFQVEEIPAYHPDGTGDHLFLWIEKRNLSAPDLIKHLSRQLSLKERDIGMAGQKDKVAVTRQFVSVPAAVRSEISKVESDEVKLLLVAAHRNKLRTGHLRGNRFRVTLRPAGEEPFSDEQFHRIRDALLQITQNGFPNFFGPQRFGRHGRNLKRNRQPATGTGRRTGRAARFQVSVWQAAVFNLVLAERVRRGEFRSPIAGDVVCRRGGIRPFRFSDRGSIEASELIPMGPMPGSKMLAAEDDALEFEQEALQQLDLSFDQFAAQGKRSPGTRRRMVEWPTATSVTRTDDGGLQCNFELSAGVFATVLLAELFHPLIDASTSESSAAPSDSE